MSWRNLCCVLALLCTYQAWRGCRRAPAPTAEPTVECSPHQGSARAREPRGVATPTPDRRDRRDVPATANAQATTSPAPGLSLGGFRVPAWAAWLAPQPGENLLDYRDRIVPIAQAAIAPHRARVARSRDDFAKLANLDAQQRAQLDAAVQDAAGAIQDKVMSSLLSGELAPAHFKPMTGVTLARDVLDVIDQANRRFVATLREDQKAALAMHPFDLADYLLFSARWEDALGITH